MKEELLLQIRADISQLSKDMGEVKGLVKGLDDDIGKLGKGAEKAAEGFKKIGKTGAFMKFLREQTGGVSDSVIDIVNGLGKATVGARAFSLALTATGIGAIVVAVGAIVAYWDEIVLFATGYSRELNDQTEELQKQAKQQSEALKLAILPL